MENYTLSEEILNDVLTHSEFSIFERELEEFEHKMLLSSINRLLFKTKMTEKMLGSGEDNVIFHELVWELWDRQSDAKNFFKKFFYFIPPKGISTNVSNKFKDVAVIIDEKVFESFMKNYISLNPNQLHYKTLKSVRGLTFADIKFNEAHKIIGEKIVNIYHLKSRSGLGRWLPIILEFESGMMCYMNGYFINLWREEDYDDVQIEPIKFNNHEMVERCYKGIRVSEIFEDEYESKNLRLENGYEIGINNQILGNTLLVGKYFWEEPKDNSY